MTTLSYTYNFAVGYDGSRILASFDTPAQTPALDEAFGINNVPTFLVDTTTNKVLGRRCGNVQPNGSGPTQNFVDDPRGLPYGGVHLDGSNLLYCDGHVKWGHGVPGDISNTGLTGSALTAANIPFPNTISITTWMGFSELRQTGADAEAPKAFSHFGLNFSGAYGSNQKAQDGKSKHCVLVFEKPGR